MLLERSMLQLPTLWYGTGGCVCVLESPEVHGYGLDGMSSFQMLGKTHRIVLHVMGIRVLFPA